MRDVGAQHVLKHVTDSALAEVAADLRVIDHHSGWSRTLAIGELILTRFFNGNIQEWRTHRWDKDASIRRLAQRSDCPLSRSALSQTVALYVACRDLPVGKIKDQLTPGHVAAALRLGPSQRIAFLERAIACRWTVREVRAQVAGMRRSDGEKRGRPRSSPARAALTFVKNAALALVQATVLLDAANHAEADVVRNFQLVLRQMEEEVATTRTRLTTLSAVPHVTLAPPMARSRVDRPEAKRAAG